MEIFVTLIVLLGIFILFYFLERRCPKCGNFKDIHEKVKDCGMYYIVDYTCNKCGEEYRDFIGCQ